MSKIDEIYDRVLKNPRTCEICGDKETRDNLMLKYDNGKIMCDDCMIKWYMENDPNFFDI